MEAAAEANERRLAGAVLADQRMHFAEIEREIHVIERTGGAELLA
jgi:hypothetical protein